MEKVVDAGENIIVVFTVVISPIIISHPPPKQTPLSPKEKRGFWAVFLL
jgi:hypothetical protein